VKNAVKKITTIKMLNKPRINEINLVLLLDSRLTPTKIGKMGKIHGDNIDITPVKKERIGKISI
jgi:hypothetical protein